MDFLFPFQFVFKHKVENQNKIVDSYSCHHLLITTWQVKGVEFEVLKNFYAFDENF